MDIYRILKNFDAVNSKQALDEGAVKRELHAMADKMTKAEFVAKANEHGMGAKEAAEFWINCKGEDDEELDEPTLRGFGSASGSACGARGLCLSGLKASGVPSSKGFSVLRFTGTAGRSSITSSGWGFWRSPGCLLPLR